jgi:hypothetical protein
LTLRSLQILENHSFNTPEGQLQGVLDVLILPEQEDSGIRNPKSGGSEFDSPASLFPRGSALLIAVRASPALLKMFALALCINQRH